MPLCVLFPAPEKVIEPSEVVLQRVGTPAWLPPSTIAPESVKESHPDCVDSISVELASDMVTVPDRVPL